MCNPLAVMAVATIAGTASGIQQSNKANKLAKQQQAQQDALTATQQATRSASQQSAYDVSSDNAGGSDTGLGNTFLNGAGGVNNSTLNLGNTTSGNNTLGG